MGHVGEVRHRAVQEGERAREDPRAGVQEEDESGAGQPDPGEEQTIGQGEGRGVSLQHSADLTDQELRQAII